MATIAQLMAGSLEQLHKLQNQDPNIVLKGTTQLSRVHLKRLLDNGWLQEVIKGWYIPSRPGNEGDTTVWYTSYWYFVSAYLKNRFGDEWVVSPDQSLDLHSGKTIVPEQLIIKAPDASNTLVSLPYGHTILPLRSSIPSTLYVEKQYGLNLYTLEEALVNASPAYYERDEVSARTCLSMVNEASEILRVLLETGATTRAGRIAGALRNNGQPGLADEILKVMREFGYKVTETDPFEKFPSTPFRPERSHYATRIRQMWAQMRGQVIENFPVAPSAVTDKDEYIESIEEKYAEDAYHSLSIEGYKVSKELIDKVREGNWKPDDEDKDQKRALAARGYYQAFNSVKDSIKKIIRGNNPGRVVDSDHGSWYRQMWMPFVTAGIIEATHLVGYRREQVYIRGSRHKPLNPEAISEGMSVLFDLLAEEPDARVRAVLGHFIFVYIHPYLDGNGRMARFILNAMLASGGYPWTIVPVENRGEYMDALERASVSGDISDFSRLIARLVGN